MRGGSRNGSRGLYRMGKVGTWEESRRVKGLEVRELEEEEEGFQRAGRIESRMLEFCISNGAGWGEGGRPG